MLLISSQFSLTTYVSCYYSSRKELFFKRKNKSVSADGAKAKMIGFKSSEDLMSTYSEDPNIYRYYNNNNQPSYFANIKNVYKEQDKLK